MHSFLGPSDPQIRPLDSAKNLYFKAGANKLVNLIGNEHMTLAKLSINIVAWISLPNKANDLKKNLAVSPKYSDS
jgi:hypothetical protein